MRRRPKYDAGTDTFYFRFDDRPTTAKHLADEVWLLIDPATSEVAGFFVEDFERIFLKRHPDLQVAWSNAHPPIVRRVSRSLMDGFTRVLLGWLAGESKEVRLALQPG